MKIAIVTETYPPEINGVALTVESMVNNLLDQGHEILLVRPRQPGSPAQRKHLQEQQVRSLPLPKYHGLRLGLATPRQVSNRFDEFQPDAAYIATEGPLGWASLRAARAYSIPVLTGFHTRFDQYMSHYGLRVIQQTAANYMRRFHNASNGTLVPTQELKDFLLNSGYRNVRLLERAVDTQRFSPRHRSESLRRQWAATDSDPVALHVGRLAAEKNLQAVIDAYRGLQTQHPRARLVVVGDGPARSQLQQTNPDVHFTGALMGAALSQHYASADLFLFPSLTDTFGNVVLESLASGVPVVAFDYAAAADFVQAGVNGFLAPFGDNERFVANARVLANIACELPALREGARQSVQHLKPSRVAQKLVELFVEGADENLKKLEVAA